MRCATCTEEIPGTNCFANDRGQLFCSAACACNTPEGGYVTYTYSGDFQVHGCGGFVPNCHALQDFEAQSMVIRAAPGQSVVLNAPVTVVIEVDHTELQEAIRKELLNTLQKLGNAEQRD